MPLKGIQIRNQSLSLFRSPRQSQSRSSRTVGDILLFVSRERMSDYVDALSASLSSGYSSSGYGYGKEECCPLVVDFLCVVVLLFAIGGAALLLNQVIMITIMPPGRRRRRSFWLQHDRHLDVYRAGTVQPAYSIAIYLLLFGCHIYHTKCQNSQLGFGTDRVMLSWSLLPS